MVEQLIFNTLYMRGDLTGRNIADALGLSFSAIEPLMDELKVRQMFEVKKSLGYGLISSLFALRKQGANGRGNVLRSTSTSGQRRCRSINIWPRWKRSVRRRAAYKGFARTGI